MQIINVEMIRQEMISLLYYSQPELHPIMKLRKRQRHDSNLMAASGFCRTSQNGIRQSIIPE